MIVAVIDVGTNTVRLLVASVAEDLSVEVLHTGLRTTRLGEGIASGYLNKNAMERTLLAMKELLAQAKAYRSKRYVMAATSAVRDAANGGEFAELALKTTGVKLDVLSGEAEASFSHRGVLAGLSPQKEKVVVLDVGGGSTELSWSEQNVVRYSSVNVGAVRMTEGRHNEEYIANLLQPVIKKAGANKPQELVAVGGTATTMAAMVQKLTHYDPQKVHQYKITLQQVNELLQKLNNLTVEERKKLPGLQPERADIIPAGVQIIRLVLMGLGYSFFTVSESDILWGLAVQAAIDCRK